MLVIALVALGVFWFLRRRSRRGLDRIRPVRPGDTGKDGEILAMDDADDGEAFAVIEPFTASSAALHERIPLSPSSRDLSASASFEGRSSGMYDQSVSGRSEGSKYVF